ncbi:MAG: T9SS type A sorting domain-containing protein, partial [Bacteroidia bacterium]
NGGSSPLQNFKITTSGVLTFSQTSFSIPAYASVALTSSTIPDSSICLLGITPIGANSAYANIVTKTFGTAPNRQYWVTYCAYNELSLGNSAFFWGSFVFEETTNNIYYVDQRRAPATTTHLSVGVRVTSSNISMVAGSPNYNSLAGSDASPADNSYYMFVPGVQPTNDAAVMNVPMPVNLIISQAPFSISATVKNMGTAVLNSITLNYSVNGGSTVSSIISGLSVASSATSIVSVIPSNNWTPSAIGTYSIKVWTSLPNGSADATISDDSASVSVSVWTSFVQKNVLHEIFTSSTCPPCVGGNAKLQQVVNARPGQWNVIKYQENFPGTGDPYYTSECGTRFTYYGATYAPWLTVDGDVTWNGPVSGGGPNANSYTTGFFDKYGTQPAFITIAASQTMSGNKITVSGTVTPLHAITSTSLNLRIAVCEKSTLKNVKTNGEVIFYNVMKKMLPSASGYPINLSAGTPVTFNQSFTFPGVYRLPADGQAANIINLATENSVEDFTNLIAIVFVQDDNTKQVLQSGATQNQQLLAVNETTVSTNKVQMNVFPNPSNGSTRVEFSLNSGSEVEMELINVVGEKVLSVKRESYYAGENAITFDASNLNSGVYFINLKTNEGTTIQKFIVTK